MTRFLVALSWRGNTGVLGVLLDQKYHLFDQLYLNIGRSKLINLAFLYVVYLVYFTAVALGPQLDHVIRLKPARPK
jgi:hypothetical protein